MTRLLTRPRVFAAIIVALVLGELFLPRITLADLPPSGEIWVAGFIDGLGILGPIALVGLMALAIVLSPIPSGPIAIAAGAMYGTYLGGALSILGAQIGAVMAFGAARYLGYDAVRRSDNRLLRYIAQPRSQWSLMLIVFASRLIPFISFDAISYAAGITNLSFWRFAIATILGIVPISLFLAAMGAGMISGETNWLTIFMLFGGVTLIPLLVAWLRG